MSDDDETHVATIDEPDGKLVIEVLDWQGRCAFRVGPGMAAMIRRTIEAARQEGANAALEGIA